MMIIPDQPQGQFIYKFRKANLKTRKKLMEKETVEEHRLTELEKMHHRSEELKSDMEFYSLEMAFLRSLLDRYMLRLIEEESLSGLQLLNSKVKACDEKCRSFVGKAESLMSRLGLLIENPFAQDEQRVMESYKNTFEESDSFKNEIKRLKHEVFDHVAQTMRSAKAQKLIGTLNEQEKIKPVEK